MILRVRWRALLIASTIVLLLAASGTASVWAAEGEGSSNSIWVIVTLAAIWLVIIAAILITVFRIRRREKREEQEGVEFTSKEH